MAELPTAQALETMTRAQLVATYDALRPTHPQLPERPIYGRGNFTVNIKGALMALVMVPGIPIAIPAPGNLPGIPIAIPAPGNLWIPPALPIVPQNALPPILPMDPPIAATVHGSPYRSRATAPTISFTTATPREIPTTYSRPLCRAISWTPSPTLEPSIWRLLCPPAPVQALSSNTTLTKVHHSGHTPILTYGHSPQRTPYRTRGEPTIGILTNTTNTLT